MPAYLDLTASDGYAEALAALRSEPGSALAEALYGPAWRSPVRPRFEDGPYRAARLPDPVRVGAFVEPILRGSVIHDGRSHRSAHHLGYWLRTPDGRWIPTDGGALAGPLLAVAEALYVEAKEAETTASLAMRRIDPDARPDARRKAFAAWQDSTIRLAVLEALMLMFSRAGRPLLTSLGEARRRSLALTDDALREIVSGWLDEALDLGDVQPDATGRLWTDEVSAALLVTDEADRLPRQTLFHGLDLVLGARRKSGPRRFWQIEADAEERAA